MKKNNAGGRKTRSGRHKSTHVPDKIEKGLQAEGQLNARSQNPSQTEGVRSFLVLEIVWCF